MLHRKKNPNQFDKRHKVAYIVRIGYNVRCRKKSTNMVCALGM